MHGHPGGRVNHQTAPPAITAAVTPMAAQILALPDGSDALPRSMRNWLRRADLFSSIRREWRRLGSDSMKAQKPLVAPMIGAIMPFQACSSEVSHGARRHDLRINIELADSDRGVYRPLQLRVARHPSESEEYFLCRVVAYCLEYTEGISFSNGLFEPDEPTIAVRDLTACCTRGSTWRAGSGAAASGGKAAPRVAVYTHKDAALLAARLGSERIHRVEALELYALDRQWLASLAARLARRMEFSLTVADRHVYLSLGEETLSSVVERIAVGADRGRS